jgi:hypothetical protein
VRPGPGRSAALAAALVLSSAGASRADGAAASESARHFATAREHMKHHRCDLALPELAASVSAEPNVVAYLNIGDCSVQRGALGAAWRAYKVAEDVALARKDDRARVAHDNAATLEGKLVRVLVAAETKDGAPVALDKDAVKIDDLAVPESAAATGTMVDPGRTHVVLVAASGYEPAHATASGDPGDTRTVRVTLLVAATSKPVPVAAPAAAVPVAAPAPFKPPAAEPEAPAAPAARPDEHAPNAALHTQRTIAYATIGVGAGAFVVGAVLGFVALGQRSDLAAAVAANPSCRGEYPNGACSLSARSALEPLESKAFGTATAATLLLATGVLLGAGGAVLYLTAREDTPRVVVTGGPGAAGLRLVQPF